MISTHVLDLMSGKPASGVAVTLARLDGDGWTVMGKAVTNRILRPARISSAKG